MNEISSLKNQSRKHLTRYEYQQVIECCDKILLINPESSWALKYKGISLYQMEKYDEAIPVYEKYYKLCSDDEDTLLTLIEIYEKKEKYGEALGLYETLLKHYKIKGTEFEYEIYKNREKLLKTRMKRYDEIIKEYDEKIENIKKQNINGLKTPGDSLHMIERKKLLTLLEEKAVYQYKNKEYDNANKTLQIVSQLYPTLKHTKRNHENYMDSWYNMLKNLLESNNNHQSFFREFFKYNTNNNVWNNKIKYGISLIEDSIVYSEILLEKNPDNIELLETIAEKTKYYNRDYSLTCWKKILDLKPDSAKAIEEILDIYSKEYSKDRAIKLINSKLYLDDIKTELLVKKIRLLESMTLYDEALETYEEYLALDLPDGLINHELTLFDKLRCMEQKAVTQYLENNYTISYEIYHEISEIFPQIQKQSSIISNNEWIMEDWYNKVLCDAIKKSDNKPEQFFKEFYKPENTQYWREKIEFLINSEYFGNPLTYCNIILSKKPDNTQIKLTKADIYYRTRRLKKATELYNEILKKEPENKGAQYRKFNLEVQLHNYQKAYNLLKTLKEYSNEINYELKTLANYLFEKGQYEQSKYCYNILWINNKDIRNISQLKRIWEKTGDKENQKQSPYYMDWIELINYRHKNYECPECGGKLIPIKYGYFPINPEDVGTKYIPGGCCVSNYSPTDYCTKCQKEINLGTYGINITTDDYPLFSYTQKNIIYLTNQIKNNPTKTIAKIRDEMNKKCGIDKEEFTKFTEKLEKLGHIKIEKNKIKLKEGYKKFYNELIDML